MNTAAWASVLAGFAVAAAVPNGRAARLDRVERAGTAATDVGAYRARFGAAALLHARWVIAVLTLAIAVSVGPGVALGGAAVAAAGVVVVRDERIEGARASRSEAWSDALSRLAAALRSGQSLSAACRVAIAESARGASREPTERLRYVAAYVEAGGSPAGALHASPGPADRVERHLAACFASCTELGIALAPVVGHLAAAQAAAQQGRREARVELSAARATGRLLAVLPFAGIGLGALVGVSAPAFLLTTAPGQLCVLLAGLFEAAGLLWLHRVWRSAC